MKKKLLLFSLLAASTLAPVSAQEVVFDFSNPANLGDFTFAPMSITELQKATYFNANSKQNKDKDRCYVSGANHVLIISDETIAKDGISFSLGNPDAYKDYPRFFFGSIAGEYPSDPTPDKFYCDMRWYQTETLEFNAPEGKKFVKVVMDATSGSYPKRVCGNTMVVTEGGTQTIADDKRSNTWEANEGSEVTKLEYQASSDSPTQMAYSITFTLADLGGSAVSEIAADNNAPAEYYDLTGNRRNAVNLVPGIYILKKGSDVKKVIVK